MYQLQQANLEVSSSAIVVEPTLSIGVIIVGIILFIVLLNLILTVYIIRSNRIVRKALFEALVPLVTQPGPSSARPSFKDFYQIRKEQGCEFTDLNSPTPSESSADSDATK